MPAKGITLVGSTPIKGKVKLLVGSVAKDWANLVGNAFATSTLTQAVTVPGASIGDIVIGVSMSVDTLGMVLSGQVTAVDTVTVSAVNVTPSAINIASGTLTVYVLKNTR